jgi:hypothetical protein
MSNAPASVVENLLSEMGRLVGQNSERLIDGGIRVEPAQQLDDSVARLDQDVSFFLTVVSVKLVQLAERTIGESFERRTSEYKPRIRSLKDERERLMTKAMMLKELAKESREAS